MTSILIGVPIALVPLTDAPSATGTAFAMPSRRTQLTWQTVHAVAPGSVTWTLQGSNDGTVWNTLDSSTAVGGEIKTVNTSVVFIRVNATAISGGSGITVLGVCRA